MKVALFARPGKNVSSKVLEAVTGGRRGCSHRVALVFLEFLSSFDLRVQRRLPENKRTRLFYPLLNRRRWPLTLLSDTLTEGPLFFCHVLFYPLTWE